jgi:hypothetical protein
MNSTFANSACASTELTLFSSIYSSPDVPDGKSMTRTEYDLLGLSLETIPTEYPQYLQIPDLEPVSECPHHVAQYNSNQTSPESAYGLHPMDRSITEQPSEQGAIFVPMTTEK